MDEVLIWVARVVQIIPVVQQLWDAIKGGDAESQLAAQMEMVRQIRGQQAREEFLLDDPGEVTKPGAE